jgi:hypothetical protein
LTNKLNSIYLHWNKIMKVLSRKYINVWSDEFVVSSTCR